MSTYIYEEDDDFKPWHLAKDRKQEEGKKVIVYYSYRPSNRQRYWASGYGYATYRPYLGWKIENFPGGSPSLKVHSWQYPDLVDWDQMLYNYSLIDKVEFKRRKLGAEESLWVK